MEVDINKRQRVYHSLSQKNPKQQKKNPKTKQNLKMYKRTPKGLWHSWEGWLCLNATGCLNFAPLAPRSFSKKPPDSGGSCRIYSRAWCGMQPKKSFSWVLGQAGKRSISSAIHWDPRGNWDRKSNFQIIGVFLMMSFGSQCRAVPLRSPLLQHLLSI